MVRHARAGMHCRWRHAAAWEAEALCGSACKPHRGIHSVAVVLGLTSQRPGYTKETDTGQSGMD